MRYSTTQLAWVQSLVDEYDALAADVADRHGSSFLRNVDAPSLPAANHVGRVRHGAEDDLDAFFAAVESHYAGLSYRAVRVDWFTPPPVEARLLAEAYACETKLVMGIDAPFPGDPPAVELDPVPCDDPRLARLFEAEHGAEWPEQWAVAQRRGEAYGWLVAVETGRPVGHAAWRARDGYGLVEALCPPPGQDGAATTTALLGAAVRAARDAGADLVAVVAPAGTGAIEAYRRLGFEPLFPLRDYIQRR